VDSDDDEVSATSVIDLTDDDLLLSGLPTSVKQEVVNEDSVNHISDGGVDFPRQEKVNPVAESNDPSPQDGGVRRSRRNKTPREMYVPSMQGKSYANNKYDGVGFPTVKKRLIEVEELRN